MMGGSVAADAPVLRRILMTADAVGGVWQYAEVLSRTLAENGMEVLLVTMGKRPSADQKATLHPAVQLLTSDYALEWDAEPWVDVDRAGAWLLELARGFQPDVVHLNGYAHASLPWGVPKLVVAHSCVFSWFKAVHNRLPDADWSEYRQRIQAGLEAADRIVTPSEFMAHELQEHYRTSPDKITVIPNCTAPAISQSGEKEAICLAAGRVWDEAKNFRVLESVAPLVSCPIYLAGAADDTTNGSVTKLGALSHRDLMGWMSRAAIFVHPAFYEPFGLAVLEAAEARCCLVLSDIPSARELWGDAALFVPPQDGRGFADVITGLLANPEECRSRGEMAWQRAQRFSQPRFYQNYRSVYGGLLQPHGQKSEVAA